MEVDVVTDPDEVSKIVPVIESAWGLNRLDVLIKDVVASMRFHGGLVLLARDGDKVIGMHYSFPGYRHGRVYLYSHMTGVMQDQKYHGVGKAIKLAQREWARSHGYNLIAWTYDPLMALNANFNFNKLGVFSRTYLRNFYGMMEDSLNFGLPTDRFVAEWWTDYEKPRIPEPGNFANSPTSLPEFDENVEGDSVGVYIPKDFVSLKKQDKELAIRVRIAFRENVERYFSKGYAAAGFNHDEAYYTLIRKFKPAEKYGNNVFLD